MDDRDDGLRFFRGLIFAIGLSLAFYSMVGIIWWVM